MTSSVSMPALAALAGLMLAACATHDAAAQQPFTGDGAPVLADIIGDSGSVVGEVRLVEGPNGILGEVSLMAGAVAPGWHGLHLHQVGDCSDIGSFTNSGGHVGKIEGGHGLLNPAGPEAGDLVNLHAAADGSAKMEFFTNLVTLNELRDEDGSAIILHESRDDHLSQPIGGAGGRVGCAAIR